MTAGDRGVPEVMDVEQLGAYLGMGRSKIYQLARRGAIPASRIGQHLRFHKPLVDEWMARLAEDFVRSPAKAGKRVGAPVPSGGAPAPAESA